MKIKMVMILSACVVHNAYASSLDYGIHFDSSMREAAYALSSSVKDAFKQYLFGSTAVLGTAAIMYRVIKPKKEFTGLTRGILELVERSEKELREEQEEIATLEEKARRMEKIRIVRQVVIREASLVEGGVSSFTDKEKRDGKNECVIKAG